MNYPFQSTTIMCYYTFYKFRMKKLKHFHLMLTNPCCAYGQSQDAHLDFRLWIQYFLRGHFLDVTKATPQFLVGNMTQKVIIIFTFKSTLMINCSCFLLMTNPWFFTWNDTNNKAKHYQLIHVLPNPHISHGIYPWRNEGWPSNLHGSSQWLHWYLALHNVGYGYPTPTSQFFCSHLDFIYLQKESTMGISFVTLANSTFVHESNS